MCMQSLSAFVMQNVFSKADKEKEESATEVGCLSSSSILPNPPFLWEVLYGCDKHPKKWNSENGFLKKRLCVKALCHRLNREISVDEALAEYEKSFTNWW